MEKWIKFGKIYLIAKYRQVFETWKTLTLRIKQQASIKQLE